MKIVLLETVNAIIDPELVEAYHRNEEERLVLDCKLKKIWEEAFDSNSA